MAKNKTTKRKPKLQRYMVFCVTEYEMQVVVEATSKAQAKKIAIRDHFNNAGDWQAKEAIAEDEV